jgi:hypothetical protein
MAGTKAGSTATSAPTKGEDMQMLSIKTRSKSVEAIIDFLEELIHTIRNEWEDNAAGHMFGTDGELVEFDWDITAVSEEKGDDIQDRGSDEAV